MKMKRDAIRQVIREEISIEIALRERILATIRSRIEWATALKQALLADGSSGQDIDFRASALETLDDIESPLDFIFNRPQFAGSTQTSIHLVPKGPPELPSRSVRARPRADPTTSQVLFLRDESVLPPTLVKLVCPDCNRSDFPNMQGLFNHCRLGHQKHYGSHDEAMQACATVVSSAEETDWVLAHGMELVGVSIPSVRRLFELAVGGEQPAFAATQTSSNGADGAGPITDILPSSTHLSRTLGHHKDTPALAPFLGKVAKRRGINAYDEDVDVDISTLDGFASGGSRRAWRMRYEPRNAGHHQGDTKATDDQLQSSDKMGKHPAPASARTLDPTSSTEGGSRFHINARIVVADRSQWLPPNRRLVEHPDHTHRWMVSCESPSYSIHITTFLKSMTVCSSIHPAPSTLLEPVVVTTPPFAVIGSTDKPFLARVSLQWADGSALDVEHWVELDLTKASTPALGEEQMLDVELDRRTEFLPQRPNRLPTRWDDTVAERRKERQKASAEPPVPEYVKRLRALLPRFPMTARDLQSRHPGKLPYKLAASPTQLRALIEGRRKAIEWGRARAIRDAYTKSIGPTDKTEEGLIALETADVFRWLEDEGHFVRPAATKTKATTAIPSAQNEPQISRDSSSKVYCAVCGIAHDVGTSSKAEVLGSEIKAEGGEQQYEQVHSPAVCPLASLHPSAFPLLDATQFLRDAPADMPIPYNILPALLHPPGPHTITLARYSSRGVVEAADPHLTLAIRDIVSSVQDVPPRSETLFHREDSCVSIFDELAPFSLLGLLLKPLVSRLVRGGLDVAERDRIFLMAMGRIPPSSSQRLLTTSHIMRGLRQESGRSALFLAFSRLGVPVNYGRQLPISSLSTVKAEEE